MRGETFGGSLKQLLLVGLPQGQHRSEGVMIDERWFLVVAVDDASRL